MAAARIMIVEDERVVAAQMARSIEELGYRVVAVEASGEDAVLTAESAMPELILMDIMLEGEMDGIEAATLIRSRFNLPVIYTTAYSEELLLARARETHPVGYLVKPVRSEELRANIEIALATQRMQRQLRESEERYRAVVETQTELICRYLPDGTFTFVNEAYCRYFDKKSEELIGRKFAPNLLAEDRERDLEHFSLFAPESPVHSHEIRTPAPDGKERWLRWTDRAFFDDRGKLIEFQGVGRDVTDLRKAHTDLLASRAVFSSIVEGSNDPVLVVRKEGDIAYANRSAAAYLSRPGREVTGWQLGYPLKPDETTEIEVALENGTMGVAEMRTEPTDWHGEAAWLVKLRDVTDRKRAEAKAEYQRALLEGVNKILRETLLSRNEQDVVNVGLTVALEMTGSKFGWIGEINNQGLLDTIAHSISGWKACTIPRDRSPLLIKSMQKRGIWATVIKTEQSQIINHPASHPDSVGCPDGHPRIESFLGVPLKRADETFGMIALANKEGGYTLEDVAAVEALSFAFVEALTRRRAQDKLAESEARYRSLFNDSIDGVYETTREGLLIEANRSLAAIFGYERDEMIGMNVRGLYSNPADRAEFTKDIEERGFVKDYSLRFRRKDDTEIYCELSSTLRMDEAGHPVGYGGILRDVTGQKLSARRLRESQQMLQLVLDSIPQGVFWKDRNSVYLGCNRVFADDAGLESPDNIVGKTDYDLAWTRDQSHWFRRCDARVIDSGNPEHHILEALTNADGEEQLIDTTRVPLRDTEGSIIGVLGAYENVSERKLMENKLRSSEQRYRLLTESSPVGISIIRNNGWVYVNPALVRMFGYLTDAEILEQSVEDLYASDSWPEMRRLIKEVEKPDRVAVGRELQGNRKDGTTFDLSVRLIGIEYLGKPAVLTFVIDESETKALQAQLLRVQKMESLGTLAGGIAHDFNNLLTVIQGYTELLLADRVQEDADYNDLQIIGKTAERGADLVRRILTYSRQVESKKQWIDINEELRHGQKLLRRTIPKMIGIKMRLGKKVKRVYADPVQLEQILFNLAVNAVYAMPDGGELTVRTDGVHLDGEFCACHVEANPGEYVLIEVSDTGCGMEKSVVDHIFEPFFTTKGPGEGTGLGLAMVFGIVKAHDGHVACYSEPGIGTTFKIYLPVTEEEETVDESTEADFPAFGTETILLVDDEKSITRLGKRMLGDAGYTVLTACNGKEALEVYRKVGSNISLVILDLIMPEMGGKECLEELLKLDPQVKVIASSGFISNNATKEILKMNCKGFVDKPFKRTQMLRAIRAVLDA